MKSFELPPVPFDPVSSTPGRFTVSFDFEIGWGSIENDLWKRRQANGVYERLRPAMRTFISALDDLEIPCTWATVGAMIDDPAPDVFEHLPQDIREKTVAFLKDAAPLTRDGRDLYDMVANAKAPQDIGSHTYSHVRFTYPGFDEEPQKIDMALAREALQRRGTDDPGSFVYPLNHANGARSLAENGFRVARVAPVSTTTTPSRFRRFYDQAFASPPVVAVGNDESGLTYQSGSFFYNWRLGKSAPLRKVLIARQIKAGFKGTRQGSGMHLWLHPFNLSETPGLLDGLIGVLRDAAKMRDKGVLEIVTMADK